MRRTTRTAILSLVAVALLVSACELVATPSPSPTSTATASPAASAARPTPTPIAVPTPRATGITPTSDRIVLQVESWTDLGPWGPGVFVYDDGSIVDARSSPIRARLLSAPGLDWVVDRVRESGLFSTSRSIPFDPPDSGFTTFRVTFNDADARTWVQASNPASDAESRALIELAEHILDPGVWVPSEGWSGGNPTPQPYVARQTRITSEATNLDADAWVNAAQTLDRRSWPLAESPIDVGQPIEVAGEPDRALRCGFISGAEELAARGRLQAFEGGWEDRPLVATWYFWTTGPGLLELTLRPLLPHEARDCGVAELPAAPTLAAAPRPSLATLLAFAQTGWSPTGTQGLSFFVQATDVRGDTPAQQRVSYYADGTILFHDPPPPVIGIGALRLSAEGRRQLDEALARSGLLDASYSEQIPDDVEIDTMFSIVTDDVVLNGSDRGVDGRADKIVELARRLLDPVAWLPATAWIGDPGELLQYRPPAVRVSIRREFDDASALLPPAEQLRWPWSGTIWTFGQLDPELPGTEARVATLTPADALKIVRAVQELGASGAGGVTRVEYWLGTTDRASKAVIELSIAAGDWGI
jgi:hypothetical protein